DTGAFAAVGGAETVIGCGTKDEAIRDHNSVHAPAEFEATAGCHVHPSNGWDMVITALIDHFFDEVVPAFTICVLGILPYFVDPPRRVMVVMGPTGKSAPSGQLDRRLSREVHAPSGSLFTPRSLGGQIGNHLPDGGCGHEFLRRTSVPRRSEEHTSELQ